MPRWLASIRCAACRARGTAVAAPSTTSVCDAGLTTQLRHNARLAATALLSGSTPRPSVRGPEGAGELDSGGSCASAAQMSPIGAICHAGCGWLVLRPCR